MKAQLRVSRFNGDVGFHFILDGQKLPLMPGEQQLFIVSHEGESHKLVDDLKVKAREEAARRGIKIDGI